MGKEQKSIEDAVESYRLKEKATTAALQAALVTATVAEPEGMTLRLTVWEEAGFVTKEAFDALAIPEMFLRNPDNTFKWPLTQSLKTHIPIEKARSLAAPVPSAAEPDGSKNGSTSKSRSEDEFSHFKIDHSAIEAKIKKEADKRWRNWMPTKTDRTRPRLSTYVRLVRKEFYP